MTRDRARDRIVEAMLGTTDRGGKREVGHSNQYVRSRLTFCLGAAAVAFVLLKKAACGGARIRAGLAAAVWLRSLAPAKRDCRLIFMLRAVIVDAMANGSRDAG